MFIQGWLSLIAGVRQGNLPSSGNKQKGISFIELLVTLVLISISMLGLLAVQARALDLNNQAYLRSQAVNLAYDMAERIRLNSELALAGSYNMQRSDAPVNTCPANPLAASDTCNWLTQLNVTLPAGDGIVSLNGRDITISVFWTGERSNIGAEQFNLTMRL